MLKVKDLMTKDIITVSESINITQAALIMKKHKVSCLIVKKNKKAHGVVTERDLVYKILCINKNKKRYAVKDIMSRPVITISPDTSVLESSTVMKYSGIKQIPVVEKDKIIGIITQTDITHNLYDTFYLATFNKKEIYFAFLIFVLMILFLPPVFAFVFLGFVVFSQLNVIVHFISRK